MLDLNWKIRENLCIRFSLFFRNVAHRQINKLTNRVGGNQEPVLSSIVITSPMLQTHIYFSMINIW